MEYIINFVINYLKTKVSTGMEFVEFILLIMKLLLIVVQLKGG